jgi:large subunit ribosomal protein L19
MSTAEETTKSTSKMLTLGQAVAAIQKDSLRADIPEFGPGDVVRVHAKIREGNKERVQIFEGVVLKRTKGDQIDATFTVRKISYNIGVERTFPLHSPRVEKIERISRSKVRRARLFYLRPLRGKASRLKTLFDNTKGSTGNQAA